MGKLFKLQEESFKNITLPEIAYFYGLMWADGHVGKNEFRLEILDLDLKSIWPVLQKVGFTDYSTRFRKNSIRAQSSVRFYRQNILQYFHNFGYMNKSTGSADKIWEQIPENLKIYFIRGFLDGDGSIAIMKNNAIKMVFYGNVDADCSFLTHFCKVNNINYSLRQKARPSKNNKTHHYSYLDIGGKQSILQFGNLIYQNYEIDRIGLQRKYHKFEQIRDMIRDGIPTINKRRKYQCKVCGGEFDTPKIRDICPDCNKKQRRINLRQSIQNQYKEFIGGNHLDLISLILTTGVSYPTAKKYATFVI